MMPSPGQFAFASCFKLQTHFVVARFCSKLCHASLFFYFTCVSGLLRPILTVLRDAGQHVCAFCCWSAFVFDNWMLNHWLLGLGFGMSTFWKLHTVIWWLSPDQQNDHEVQQFTLLALHKTLKKIVEKCIVVMPWKSQIFSKFWSINQMGPEQSMCVYSVWLMVFSGVCSDALHWWVDGDSRQKWANGWDPL